MRSIGTARVLGLAAAAAMLLGLTAVDSARAVAPATADGVTFSAPSITVSALAQVPQTITVHIVDPTADPVVPSPNLLDWMFELDGTGGKGTLRHIELRPAFVSGTEADGIWTATAQIPSTADGSWVLTDVEHPCFGGCLPVVVPNASPTFVVTGHHQPRLSVGNAPLPYPQLSGSLKGRVIDVDTGRGMPGVTVAYGNDTDCVQDPGTGDRYRLAVAKRTDAAGYYAFGPVQFGQLQCVSILGSVRFNSDGYYAFSIFRALRSWTTPIKPLVTAAAASWHATTGSRVAVKGQVFDWGYWDGRGRTVQIQQLHGRTAWRTVQTVNVRLNARWNGSVTPTVKGSNIFRASTPALDRSASSVSATFVVVGR